MTSMTRPNPRDVSALITPWRPQRKAAQELTKLTESRKKRSAPSRRLTSRRISYA
jgi:hypothetical protein